MELLVFEKLLLLSYSSVYAPALIEQCSFIRVSATSEHWNTRIRHIHSQLPGGSPLLDSFLSRGRLASLKQQAHGCDLQSFQDSVCKKQAA